ncbi:MAG: MtrB/PioB family outer membrane beta-barrel protein [Deltaproteobacteria bacterium]|nr:MtrB/PioB family outer membrane beta-barrel protein [Deltaproteobacteria bacterium]
MKRIALFMILALCLALVPALSWAGQTTGSVGIGIQGVNIDDSREGAAQYLTADQGGNATFDMNINGNHNGIKYDFGVNFLHEDDLGGQLDLDLKRYFRTKNSYQKFLHWLENDDLVNYNVNPDFAFPAGMDATHPFTTAAADKAVLGHPELVGPNVAVVRNTSWGDDMYVVREELVSDNEFIIPGAEFIKLHAKYRMEQRTGYEQTRTMSKCGGCHLAGDKHKIDEETQDFSIGATAHLGLVTLDYTFLRRTFDENSKPPVNQYMTANAMDTKLTYFGNEGDLVYSSTPDSEKDSHIVKAQLALAMNTTVFGSYVHSEIDNNTATDNFVGADVTISDDPSYDYDAYALRLTSAPVSFMTMSFKYRHENLDADDVVISYDDTSYDPQGANSAAIDPTLFGLHGFSQEHDGWPWERESSLSRDTDTYGAEFKFKVFKRTNLLVGWEREVEDVDTELKTTSDTYSIALNSRAVKDLSLRFEYSYEDIDDPFVHERAAYADPDAMLLWLRANVDPVGCAATPGYCSVKNLPQPSKPDSVEYYVMYNSRSLDLTSEPESVHKFKAHATYNISPKITVSGHFLYNLEEVKMDVPGHGNSFDKEMYALGADLFFAPVDNLTFTLAYNYMDMEDQAFLSAVAYGG